MSPTPRHTPLSLQTSRKHLAAVRMGTVLLLLPFSLTFSLTPKKPEDGNDFRLRRSYVAEFRRW